MAFLLRAYISIITASPATEPTVAPKGGAGGGDLKAVGDTVSQDQSYCDSEYLFYELGDGSRIHILPALNIPVGRHHGNEYEGLGLLL